VRSAAEGAAVVAASLNDTGSKDIVEDITESGGKAAALHCHVATEENNAAVVAAIENFGSWTSSGPTPECHRRSGGSPSSSRPSSTGSWPSTRVPRRSAPGAAFPALQARGGGSFILTASLSGLKGRPDTTAYQASKGAATMLTQSQSKEFGPHQIRVNSICPTEAETPM
jgi:3-oxoacyl-[acyl-carrier protein] reductase